ncbi:MAG: hypothetical protein AABX82_01055 [Nanoarchaeota archaeon]
METIVIDFNNVKTLTTPARPERKQNIMYEIKKDGKTYWCERSKYCWSTFDQNMYTPIWKKEGVLLFGEEVPFFFDQDGRLWYEERLTSKYLLNFYTKNPLKFVQIMSQRVNKIKRIIAAMREVNKTIYTNDARIMSENFKKIYTCFDDFYDSPASIFILYDELVYRFKQVLNEILEKKEANTYFSQFLQAEMTKEAVRLGHIQEFGTDSRSSTYGQGEPIIFYKEPKFFYETELDITIFQKVMSADVSEEKKQEFFALRLITPIAIQINEEAQYVESRILTAHFRVLIENIANLFIDKKYITKKEHIENIMYEQILDIIEKDNQALPWIFEYLEVVDEALGVMDFRTIQPFDNYQFEPLIAKHIIEKLQRLIDEAEKQKVTTEELAKLLPTTSGLRCQLYFTLLQMKCAKTPKEQRIKIANFFYEMIKARAVEDVFGRKSNISQTKEQVKELVQKTKLQEGNSEVAKELGRLYNALYNFCAGLYLDFYIDYSAENEGPYDISEMYGPGHILVIKKFLNMQTEIWPDIKIPYNNIVLYTVYKNVKYTCDMISIHSRYEGDVINGLAFFSIIADGKWINDNEEIKKIIEIMSNASVQQWKYLKKIPQEHQQEKGAWIKMYGIKTLFEKVGLDWEPGKEMLIAAKGKLKDNVYWQIPGDKEKQKEYWKKMYDPTIDFYPKGEE